MQKLFIPVQLLFKCFHREVPLFWGWTVVALVPTFFQLLQDGAGAYPARAVYHHSAGSFSSKLLPDYLWV